MATSDAWGWAPQEKENFCYSRQIATLFNLTKKNTNRVNKYQQEWESVVEPHIACPNVATKWNDSTRQNGRIIMELLYYKCQFMYLLLIYFQKYTTVVHNHRLW